MRVTLIRRVSCVNDYVGENIEFGEGASKDHYTFVIVVLQRINYSVIERTEI